MENDEGEHGSQASRDDRSTDGMAYAYADEPYVGKEWLKKYEKEEEEDKKLEEAVQARQSGFLVSLITCSIYYGTSDIYTCMRTAIDSQSILQAAMRYLLG